MHDAQSSFSGTQGQLPGGLVSPRIPGLDTALAAAQCHQYFATGGAQNLGSVVKKAAKQFPVLLNVALAHHVREIKNDSIKNT